MQLRISQVCQHTLWDISEKTHMFDHAYRLVRATAAVVWGATRQVCKVLPENSVIVLEGSNEDGKTVNVRCGTEKMWMFARDLMERCKRLSRPEVESLPIGLKLLAQATTDDKNNPSTEPAPERAPLVGAGPLQDDV